MNIFKLSSFTGSMTYPSLLPIKADDAIQQYNVTNVTNAFNVVEKKNNTCTNM